MKKIDQKRNFHLAGIIPVAGQPLDFQFPWHDCCLPIAQNYLAIERSVVECAYAGCETIWIVCNEDMQPLIRHRLGDYVKDPVWAVRPQDPRSSERQKEIPIFYSPIHPKDRDKRDCLAWSVLHGAQTAYHVSLRISKWVTPDNYYVSFPYGVYPVEILREHRNIISSEETFILSFQDKTVRDGEYMGFTFTPEDFVYIRKVFREKATGLYAPHSGEGLPTKKLPIEERYTARFFGLEEVFNVLDVEKANVVNLPWHHNIDCWENYCSYLSSDTKDQITRPPKYILNYQELSLIGEVED